MIKTTFFFEHYKQTKKLRSYWKWIMIIFFISWIIFCFYQTLYPLNPEGSFLFWQNLKKLFTFSNADSKYPDFSIVQLSWKMLKLSVNYTILGTSIGFLLAFLLAPFCVLKLFSKFIAYTGKALFLFARCFPILVIIYIIQKGFSNTTAITLILLWVTQLWSVKYLTDIYQNTSLNLYNQMLQSGFSRLRAFWVGVFWQSKNKVFMIYLYALETNLRWATVLGFLGIAGIGQLINQNIPNHFENLGIPLLFLFGVIIILECLLYFFNNFILICKSRDLKKNLKKENDILILNKRKIIKNIFLFLLFLWNVYLIFSTSWNFTNWKISWKFIKQLTYFNPESWISSSEIQNPIIGIFNLLCQVCATMFTAVICSIIFAFLSSEKIVKNPWNQTTRVFLVFLRIIPSFVLLFTLDPLFWNPRTTTFVVLVIAETASLSKKFTEFINNLSSEKLKMIKFKGYSRWQTLFKFILPSIKKDVVTLSVFSFEMMIRTYIFYGIFNGNLLGETLKLAYSRNNLFLLSNHMWSIVIILMFINVSFGLIIKRKELRKTWSIWKNNKKSLLVAS